MAVLQYELRTRTFLCPDCDGYGCFADGYGRRTGNCADCGGSGVIECSLDKGDRLNLQPWTGDEGRNASRARNTRPDPLVTLAKQRAQLRPFAPPVYGSRFYYNAARARAMRPARLPALSNMEAR